MSPDEEKRTTPVNGEQTAPFNTEIQLNGDDMEGVSLTQGTVRRSMSQLEIRNWITVSSQV